MQQLMQRLPGRVLRPPTAVAELGPDTDRLLASAALLHQRLVAPLAEDCPLIVFVAAFRTLRSLPSPSLFLLLFKDKDLTLFLFSCLPLL
jgi:hypothetical protein